MTVYQVKINVNPMDGWGRSLGVREEVLGTFLRLKDAEEARDARNASPDRDLRYCDVGDAWVTTLDVA